MEWTEEKCLELISAYEKQEILWKVKHPQHYNKIRRYDAWEEVAGEMGADAETCRRKMTALVASLRREKAKIKKSMGTGKGAEEVYKSSWYAFQRLQFLWDKDKPVETRSTIPAPDNEQQEPQQTEDNIESMPSPTPPVSRKRKRTFEDQRLDQAFQILAESATKRQEENECQIFGNLVAKKMQKYSPITRAEVQHAIMNILLNADREQYGQPSHPVPSPVQSADSQHPHYPPNHSPLVQSPLPYQGYTVATPSFSVPLSSPSTTPISPHSNSNLSTESNTCSSHDVDMTSQDLFRLTQ